MTLGSGMFVTFAFKRFQNASRVPVYPCFPCWKHPVFYIQHPASLIHSPEAMSIKELSRAGYSTSCPSAPSAPAPSMLRIHLVLLWGKKKCCLYVWTSASFITKAGLKVNWSNFVDESVFNRNLFLWEGACKEVQSSCCPSSDKLCWIHGKSGPGCPTQCFSLVSGIWLHSPLLALLLHLVLMMGTVMSNWSTSTPNL